MRWRWLRFRPAHRAQVLEQFTALQPLPEPELAAKMRIRQVPKVSRWQEKANRIVRRSA